MAKLLVPLIVGSLVLRNEGGQSPFQAFGFDKLLLNGGDEYSTEDEKLYRTVDNGGAVPEYNFFRSRVKTSRTKTTDQQPQFDSFVFRPPGGVRDWHPLSREDGADHPTINRNSTEPFGLLSSHFGFFPTFGAQAMLTDPSSGFGQQALSETSPPKQVAEPIAQEILYSQNHRHAPVESAPVADDAISYLEDMMPYEPVEAPSVQRAVDVPLSTISNGLLMAVGQPVAGDGVVPYIDLDSENGTIRCLGNEFHVGVENISKVACCAGRAYSFLSHFCVFNKIVVPRDIPHVTTPTPTPTPTTTTHAARTLDHVHLLAREDYSRETDQFGQDPSLLVLVGEPPISRLDTNSNNEPNPDHVAYISRNPDSRPNHRYFYRCGMRGWKSTYPPEAVVCCGNYLVKIVETKCQPDRLRQPLFVQYVPQLPLESD